MNTVLNESVPGRWLCGRLQMVCSNLRHNSPITSLPTRQLETLVACLWETVAHLCWANDWLTQGRADSRYRYANNGRDSGERVSEQGCQTSIFQIYIFCCPWRNVRDVTRLYSSVTYIYPAPYLWSHSNEEKMAPTVQNSIDNILRRSMTVDVSHLPTSSLQQIAIFITLFFPALALIVTTLRLFYRASSKTFGYDDVFIILAMVSFTTSAKCLLVITRLPTCHTPLLAFPISTL